MFIATIMALLDSAAGLLRFRGGWNRRPSALCHMLMLAAELSPNPNDENAAYAHRRLTRMSYVIAPMDGEYIDAVFMSHPRRRSSRNRCDQTGETPVYKYDEPVVVLSLEVRPNKGEIDQHTDYSLDPRYQALPQP